MSKNEGVSLLDAQNIDPIVDNVAKVCPQGVVRRKLADISNFPQRPSIPTTTKEYIAQLQKEHVAMVKMLAQRNKIIEHSGIELDRLRVSMIKLTEQNQQLAMQNSQMLADLNSGKDQLKALRHELGCKNGLLKAIKSEIEEKAPKRKCKNAATKEEEESLKESRNNVKPRNTKRNSLIKSLGSSETVQSKEDAVNKRPHLKRQSARFKLAEQKSDEDMVEIDDTKLLNCPLLDNSVSEKDSTSVQSKENAVDKRPHLRRQSARFKSAEQKSDEDMVEIDDTKLLNCPLLDKAVSENEFTSAKASAKSEDNECSSGPEYDSQDCVRPSLCRPSRVAAKKVQSYREIPVNVKMRRSH